MKFVLTNYNIRDFRDFPGARTCTFLPCFMQDDLAALSYRGTGNREKGLLNSNIIMIYKENLIIIYFSEISSLSLLIVRLRMTFI